LRKTFLTANEVYYCLQNEGDKFPQSNQNGNVVVSIAF